MAVSLRAAPQNAVVLVGDPNNCEIPRTMSGELIAATNSCIAVGCLADIDGESEFTLGLASEVNPGHEPAFEGILDTPNRIVAVRSVQGEQLLKSAVPGQKTRVCIWVNDARAPDKVIVGIGQ
jgi:hypothetical protein